MNAIRDQNYSMWEKFDSGVWCILVFTFQFKPSSKWLFLGLDFISWRPVEANTKEDKLLASEELVSLQKYSLSPKYAV